MGERSIAKSTVPGARAPEHSCQHCYFSVVVHGSRRPGSGARLSALLVFCCCSRFARFRRTAVSISSTANLGVARACKLALGSSGFYFASWESLAHWPRPYVVHWPWPYGSGGMAVASRASEDTSTTAPGSESSVYSAGDLVEYFSSQRSVWLPTRILEGPSDKKFKIDYNDSWVNENRIRPLTANEDCRIPVPAPMEVDEASGILSDQPLQEECTQYYSALLKQVQSISKLDGRPHIALLKHIFPGKDVTKPPVQEAATTELLLEGDQPAHGAGTRVGSKLAAHGRK